MWWSFHQSLNELLTFIFLSFSDKTCDVSTLYDIFNNIWLPYSVQEVLGGGSKLGKIEEDYEPFWDFQLRNISREISRDFKEKGKPSEFCTFNSKLFKLGDWWCLPGHVTHQAEFYTKNKSWCWRRSVACDNSVSQHGFVMHNHI